jgi:hypothetical protein
LIDGARQAPPLPSQNLQRIPADAAAVVGGSLGHQVWAAQTAGMIELLAALSRTEARLPAAQVAQLQEILTSTTSMDLSGVSSSAIDPQGRPSGVALFRAADEARASALVTNVRRLFAIVRTPSFTRAIDRLLRDADVATRVPWAQLRELPTTGLPAGSYALQLPDFAALANEARSSSRTVTPAPRPAQRGRGPGPSVRVQQYLMIPEGSQVTVLVGVDARALWTATNARAGAPLDPAARGIRPGALTLSISPAGVADTMAANPETAAGSAEVRRLLAALPDRGTTPILFRMSNAETDGAQRFSLEIDIPTSTLSLLASGSQRLFRP